MHLIFFQISPLGPILESKDMGAIFSEKEQRNVKAKKCWKRAEYLKIWAKSVQNWKIFWKREGDCMR